MALKGVVVAPAYAVAVPRSSRSVALTSSAASDPAARKAGRVAVHPLFDRASATAYGLHIHAPVSAPAVRAGIGTVACGKRTLFLTVTVQSLQSGSDPTYDALTSATAEFRCNLAE